MPVVPDHVEGQPVDRALAVGGGDLELVRPARRDCPDTVTAICVSLHDVVGRRDAVQGDLAAALGGAKALTGRS